MLSVVVMLKNAKDRTGKSRKKIVPHSIDKKNDRMDGGISGNVQGKRGKFRNGGIHRTSFMKKTPNVAAGEKT